jgi:hypothetical protein
MPYRNTIKALYCEAQLLILSITIGLTFLIIIKIGYRNNFLNIFKLVFYLNKNIIKKFL